MKSLLFIMAAFLFTHAVSAQQTEDEVYIGKGKTFGNYKGTGIIIPDVGLKGKPYNGPATLTGIVVKVDWCEEDCRTIKVKKDDGTIVTVGTKDYGFTVAKELIGKRIIVEGVDVTTSYIRRRKTINQDYQKDIQFAATGIKIN